MLPSPQILGRREHCQSIRPRISAKESGGDPASPEVSTPQFAKSCLFISAGYIYTPGARLGGSFLRTWCEFARPNS